MEGLYFDSSRPIKHVDRKAIYTRLEARINYLQDFLDFNSADVEALTTGSKYIKALIPAVVNIVYKKLLEQDITARAFHTRDTSDERPIEEFYNEESPQIMRRKMFLRWYLTKLCSDPTQTEFWRYLNKVGMMHAAQERMHPLNIEYIHMGACLGFIQDIFTEALMSHPRLQLQRKVALVRAIGKIIWIQNDLIAKWRIRDGEEYAEEMSQMTLDEREGFLGDKKILGDSSSTSASSSDDDRSSVHSNPSIAPSIAPSTISACPFADMVMSNSAASTSETKIWAGK
ncbi:Protoglobin [Aspergillus parasiticus SU-1]|uniref:Protoglobin-domain-containing protein n=4 Tax=Aspergillus subgen. Circumdati TaxID=2720871 RepID=A0A5N6JD60_9EURO|nr:Protoglobin-domain-containing protein [Aspergillus parasiticus]KAB8276775.1 Protoglobin-domain-containing protein [Aspergillus minisclerotigenes]KAE8325861.1 Protoglobin-domain-containing protein [Aspergillus sergii]KJK65199.1 Protoglobin [Aspergillus parasiticus SU-1]